MRNIANILTNDGNLSGQTSSSDLQQHHNADTGLVGIAEALSLYRHSESDGPLVLPDPNTFIDTIAPQFGLNPNQTSFLRTVAYIGSELTRGDQLLRIIDVALALQNNNRTGESRVQSQVLNSIANRISENFKFNNAQKDACISVAREAIFNPTKRDYYRVHYRVTQSLKDQFPHLGFRNVDPAQLKEFNKEIKTRCGSVLNQFRGEILDSIYRASSKMTVEEFLLKYGTKYLANKTMPVTSEHRDRIVLLRCFARRHPEYSKEGGNGADLTISDEGTDNASGDESDREANSGDASYSEPPQKKQKVVAKPPVTGQRVAFWKVVDDYLKKLVLRFGSNTGSAKWKEFLDETMRMEQNDGQEMQDLSLNAVLGLPLMAFATNSIAVSPMTPQTSSGASDIGSMYSDYSASQESDSLSLQSAGMHRGRGGTRGRGRGRGRILSHPIALGRESSFSDDSRSPSVNPGMAALHGGPLNEQLISDDSRPPSANPLMTPSHLRNEQPVAGYTEPRNFPNSTSTLSHLLSAPSSNVNVGYNTSKRPLSPESSPPNSESLLRDNRPLPSPVQSVQYCQPYDNPGHQSGGDISPPPEVGTPYQHRPDPFYQPVNLQYPRPSVNTSFNNVQSLGNRYGHSSGHFQQLSDGNQAPNQLNASLSSQRRISHSQPRSNEEQHTNSNGTGSFLPSESSNRYSRSYPGFQAPALAPSSQLPHSMMGTGSPQGFGYASGSPRGNIGTPLTQEGATGLGGVPNKSAMRQDGGH